MSFYLTLPSDSSEEYFPANVATHFHTFLSEQMDLSGEWLVGLCEITYPHTWNNVEEDYKMYYKIENDASNYKTFSIPPGYYTSMFDIVNALPHDDFVKHVLIYYNNRSRKVSCEFSPFVVDIGFSPQLAFLLGYGESSYLAEKNFMFRRNGKIRDKSEYPDHNLPYKTEINNDPLHTNETTMRVFVQANEKYTYFHDPKKGSKAQLYEAEYISNFNNIPMLYLYTNIIKPQYVGHSRVPLLRTVQVSNNPGELITKTFTAPHYLPLARNTFSTVEIDIRTSTGERVSFKHGNSIVKLHFKQAKNEYFTT